MSIEMFLQAILQAHIVFFLFFLSKLLSLFCPIRQEETVWVTLMPLTSQTSD